MLHISLIADDHTIRLIWLLIVVTITRHKPPPH
jgi:hypothetical protein